MRSGFKVGRFFGIDVNIDWSWLLIFFLVTWNLAMVFGQIHSDWGTGLTWATALVASLLFFASVLAHEFAHSLVAKAQGVPVRNITLFLFGGISNIQRQPPSPRAEFLITIVGPITSILIGLFVVGAAGVSTSLAGVNMTGQTEAIAQLGPLTTLLMWLGPINLLLGLFNLIPGFPLDGGRLLRSMLWAISDDLRRATRWASWVGQAVAWLMIVAGISMIFGVTLPFFGSGFISGLWLVFIGWFLSSAAIQSYRQVVVQDILEGVPIKELMHPQPSTVPTNITVRQLINDYVMQSDERAFPVVDDGQLRGLVTLKDARQIERDVWDTTTVNDIMTPVEQLVTVNTEEDAAEIMNILAQRDVAQLPVLDDHQLAGILRRKDIVKWLQWKSNLKPVQLSA